jgi:hypothetical protein
MKEVIHRNYIDPKMEIIVIRMKKHAQVLFIHMTCKHVFIKRMIHIKVTECKIIIISASLLLIRPSIFHIAR